MPAPMTEMQRLFAVAYATNGGKRTEATIEAGYSAKSAKDIGRNTLALPHVQEMILEELTKLRARSGAVGLKALVEIAESSKVSPAARVSAARALCEHGGLLGTAKEMIETRGRAKESGEIIDYKKVLAQIGNARQDMAQAA